MVIAMLYTSIDVGIGHWYRYSLEVNIIGYRILGAFLGIVLTLSLCTPSVNKVDPQVFLITLSNIGRFSKFFH